MKRETTKGVKRKSRRNQKSKVSDQPDPFDLVFKALANSDRRKILDALCQSRLTTGEICEHLPHLDRCTVMLHLKCLERADLVIAVRSGRLRWNYLNHLPIQAAYRRWIRTFAEPAVLLLESIKKDVERA